jgi:hypothetical protein
MLSLASRPLTPLRMAEQQRRRPTGCPNSRFFCEKWDSTVPSLYSLLSRSTPAVILSVATASRMRRSRAVEGSLPDCNAPSRKGAPAITNDCPAEFHEMHSSVPLIRIPFGSAQGRLSTALSLASRPPTPLRMTEPFRATAAGRLRRRALPSPLLHRNKIKLPGGFFIEQRTFFRIAAAPVFVSTRDA